MSRARELALETCIALGGCLATGWLGSGSSVHFAIAGLAFFVALFSAVPALLFPLSAERRRFLWMFRLDTLHSLCLVAGLTAMSFVPGGAPRLG